jgi:uncharacterized YkwD family protein
MKKLILITTLSIFTGLAVATPASAASATTCVNGNGTTVIKIVGSSCPNGSNYSNIVPSATANEAINKIIAQANACKKKVTTTKKTTKAKTSTTKKATKKTTTGTSTKPSTTTTTKPTTTPTPSPTPSSSATKPATTTPATTTTSSFKEFQKSVVSLVNKERAAAGLSPLTENTELDKIATLKSEDMVKMNYFSHTSPTYGSPFEMLSQFGVGYSAAGENIAYGQATPAEVMNGWMNSPGHKANILNVNFTQIGVGIAKKSNGQLYWTQTFTRP